MRTLKHKILSIFVINMAKFTNTALSTTRKRLYQRWLDKSVMFPTLHSTIRQVLASAPAIIVQFVLEPLAFHPILADFKSRGEQFTHQLSYLARTFAFYMHNQEENLKIIDDQLILTFFQFLMTETGCSQT